VGIALAERTEVAMEINGKTAVVTGAASGIGRATATALARKGADLVLADVNDDRLNAARKEITALGRRAVAVHTDVSKLQDIRNLFDRSISEMGRVDILMNNAGVHLLGPTDKISIADWEWIVGINLWGVVYGIHVFLPHMLERGNGHIVNTASMSGLVGAESSMPYVATKFAVVGMSECLAAYVRPKGIGVTVLCPGFVATNIAEQERLVPFGDGFDDEREAFLEALKLGEWSPFEALPGGVVSPEHVAEKVVHAIKENTFLVYTHPGHKEAVVQKAQDPEGAIALLAALHVAWDDIFKGPAACKLDAGGEASPSTAV
jgi:NAD(P)-dependent dehydrogenase (short-subunit alcohol dehydrogenase family)